MQKNIYMFQRERGCVRECEYELACVCVCAFVCDRVCVRECENKRASVCVRVCDRSDRVCLCIYMYVFIYLHIHTCTSCHN